jgi:undecaprenyl-diphosphatase
MSLFSAILLGLVQGITEFLPISSSGHLAIAEELLSFTGASNVPGFFDVLLHLGTLVAVFVAYWGDIKEMVLEFFCGVRDLKNRSTPSPLPPARRLIVLIIMATLPLFVIVPFKDTIEGLAGSLYFVSFALIATGCMLFFSDRVKKGRKTEKTATMKDALIVGLGQAIATCPGISRSGTTITVGCFVGYERSFAVRFSFLMSIPAILGANILSLKDALEAGIIWGDVPVYLVGVAVAALSGYACIRLLKMIAAKGKFGAFAYYCWAVGALTLVMTVVRG